MIYSLHARRAGGVTPAFFRTVCSLSCTRYIILPRAFALADEINVILSALPPCELRKSVSFLAHK